jgi:RNA polymerase sigma-70 factor (ECF subfamily)
MLEPCTRPDAVVTRADGRPACVDERKLVERAKAQPQAFADLYELYYRRILSYAYRRTFDPLAAEEITSNTFFKALRALPGYDNRGKFGAWLFRIATNEIKLRRRSPWNRHEGDRRWREDLCRVQFASHGASPEECLEEKMRQFARLHDALSRLPERYQTALVLRYFEAMPYEEIGEVLGKKTGTIKSLIHRGLKRLRDQLEPNDTTFQTTPVNE